MVRALALASRGLYTTKPNPRVGCVIVHNDIVVAEGSHNYHGDAHAEINAFASLDALKLDTSKGTSNDLCLYTTLEPCTHHGKTPPCVDEIIKRGVRRVVIAITDQNKKVNGKGIEALKSSGIEIVAGVCKEKAWDMNKGFLKRMKCGLPWVRFKIALSLDGKYNYLDGVNGIYGDDKWISSTESREKNQHLRAMSCGILTGYKTVIHDNPRLNVRLNKPVIQPIKIVLDANKNINYKNYRIFNDRISDSSMSSRKSESSVAPKVIIYTSSNKIKNGNGSEGTLKEINDNMDFIEFVEVGLDVHNKLNLKSVLYDLASRSCNEVQIEAGIEIFSSLMNQDLLDELVIFRAPFFIGSKGKGFDYDFNLKHRFKVYSTERIGDDFYNVYRNNSSNSLSY